MSWYAFFEKINSQGTFISDWGVLTITHSITKIALRFFSIQLKLSLIESSTDITYLKLATKKILANITPNTAILRTVDSLLSDPESAEMVAIINYVKDLDFNIEAETITEDPEWFVDVPGNLITKEAVLKRSAKERIRSYLNSSKDFVNNAVCSLVIVYNSL